jgi:hypothetical protein
MACSQANKKYMFLSIVFSMKTNLRFINDEPYAEKKGI